jgi:hypothetical protein
MHLLARTEAEKHSRTPYDSVMSGGHARDVADLFFNQESTGSRLTNPLRGSDRAQV